MTHEEFNQEIKAKSYDYVEANSNRLAKAALIEHPTFSELSFEAGYLRCIVDMMSIQKLLRDKRIADLTIDLVYIHKKIDELEQIKNNLADASIEQIFNGGYNFIDRD